jgi:CheY-like chemotaxis protein
MTTAGRILIVDDDPLFQETYKDLLSAEGYTVEGVTNAADARARFTDSSVGLIILDQKLRGPGGPDEGVDLAAVAARLAPGAKVIIATAYADRAAIQRAFLLGVYDYLRKDEFFDEFLLVKVRNAMEVWRERSLAAMDHAAREREIHDTWTKARTETDNNKKGELLERLMLLLFRSVPGFQHAQVNRQSALEEIDVLVQNASADPFWQKEGSYVLAECKNWKTPVGVPELKLFRQKIEDRYGRAALGFFIAPGGYAETVRQEEWSRRGRSSLVVLLDASDIAALVAAPDRGEALKRFHARAVMAGDD